MLVNLKIICRVHAHPVHQNSVDMFGPKYVGHDFFRVESILVPYETSGVQENKILVSMSEEI